MTHKNDETLLSVAMRAQALVEELSPERIKAADAAIGPLMAATNQLAFMLGIEVSELAEHFTKTRLLVLKSMKKKESV